jgi:hypothetical protein
MLSYGLLPRFMLEMISIVGLSLRGGYVETQHWNDELRFAAKIYA